MQMTTADVYRLFFSPGEVTEIRAYGLSGKGPWSGFARGSGIVYGYFDNADDFGRCADALEQAKAPGIYFIPNPCYPDLLARAANRIKAADAKTSATSDKEIRAIRWLLVDLDPLKNVGGEHRKLAGISSTDDELAAAVSLGRDIYRYMVDEVGFSPPIPAVSGNGFHLNFRIPELSTDNSEIVKRWLEHLRDKFADRPVDIDQAVFNPARIWKLYGTTARKGDHTQMRPHRKSYIEPGYLRGGGAV